MLAVTVMLGTVIEHQSVVDKASACLHCHDCPGFMLSLRNILV
jgi:hypothetical protein